MLICEVWKQKIITPFKFHWNPNFIGISGHIGFWIHVLIGRDLAWKES